MSTPLDAALTGPEVQGKWCPQCQAWQHTTRETCVQCLAMLQGIDEDEVRCHRCGMMNEADRSACFGCYAELSTEVVAEAFIDAVGRGVRFPRPASAPRFANGFHLQIERLSQQGGFALVGGSGYIEAYVLGNDPFQRVTVQDVDGSSMLYLRRYETDSLAVAAFAQHKDVVPLVTILRTGEATNPRLEARSATSTLVAHLQRGAGPNYELVAVGGNLLGVVTVTTAYVSGMVDEHWSYEPQTSRCDLSVVTIAAVLLTARLLLGQREPLAYGVDGELLSANGSESRPKKRRGNWHWLLNL